MSTVMSTVYFKGEMDALEWEQWQDRGHHHEPLLVQWEEDEDHEVPVCTVQCVQYSTVECVQVCPLIPVRPLVHLDPLPGHHQQGKSSILFYKFYHKDPQYFLILFILRILNTFLILLFSKPPNQVTTALSPAFFVSKKHLYLQPLISWSLLNPAQCVRPDQPEPDHAVLGLPRPLLQAGRHRGQETGYGQHRGGDSFLPLQVQF